MLTLRRILFATDYSACAERAFTHAAYLADHYRADLHVLHVRETEGDAVEDYFDDFHVTPEDLASDLRLPLPAHDDRDPDQPVAFFDVEKTGSDPAHEITRYARDHDIDLIVMGTHGRRGLRHMVMGSVAEAVVRHAPCPVFTVRTQDDRAHTWVVRRVLAAVDLSERSYLAARHAAELAATYDASLDLLFVVEPPPVASTGMVVTGVNPVELREKAERMLGEMAGRLRADVPTMSKRISPLVRVGDPVHAILDVAEAMETDLLALGSHGRKGLSRLLIGSVAEEVLRRAPCPVFTLKSFGKSLVEPDVSAPATEDE